jgi:hypothetical protein
MKSQEKREVNILTYLLLKGCNASKCATLGCKEFKWPSIPMRESFSTPNTQK